MILEQKYGCVGIWAQYHCTYARQAGMKKQKSAPLGFTCLYLFHESTRTDIYFGIIVWQQKEASNLMFFSCCFGNEEMSILGSSKLLEN